MHTFEERRHDHDERGASLSVLVSTWIAAIIILAGLVVDGAQQVTAARRAESVAAGAARAAADAGGAYRLAGSNDPGRGLAAANAYLAGARDVRGQARLINGVIEIDTRATNPTLFLSVLGVSNVSATAFARADLVRGEAR